MTQQAKIIQDDDEEKIPAIAVKSVSHRNATHHQAVLWAYRNLDAERPDWGTCPGPQAITMYRMAKSDRKYFIKQIVIPTLGKLKVLDDRKSVTGTTDEFANDEERFRAFLLTTFQDEEVAQAEYSDALEKGRRVFQDLRRKSQNVV